jgi:hypothetical protein
VSLHLSVCVRTCSSVCVLVRLAVCLYVCITSSLLVLPSSRHVCLYVCPALLNLCLSACIIVRLPVCLFVCPPASRQPNDDTECKVPYYHPARCLSPNLTDHTGSNIKFYL